MATAISFDGNNLQTANILTQDIDHHGGPSKNKQAFALAHANYSVIPFINYPSKNITISGQIVGTSLSDLESRIDSFKLYFNNPSANLDIGYISGTRRYIATAEEPQISRPGGLTFADFAVTFLCVNPFGLDTSTTTALSAAGRTSASYSDAYTFLGSAPFQNPIITYTLTAFTGTNPLPVAFGNLATGQTITLNRTWVAADVVVIDTTEPTPSVKVNGVEVDFSGAFPVFAPGAQTISYSDSFTTRTFTISVVYTAAYK